jgi:hypothetical protein
VIFEHPGHVQILKGDHVNPLPEHRGQLLPGIFPEMGNLRMESGDAALGVRHIL